jgi:hypothetical protein
MSNDELWLVKEFTETMERRFEVRNFTPNSSPDVYEQAALHLAWHISGLMSAFLIFFLCLA